LSCRTAAWHNQFAEIEGDVIEMVDFTPTAIRQFLKQWDFPPPKTSDELIDTLESQAHIADLARSPLMLTIIAFLYSQPKYHLPQNRAEFYDICSRALLEEWDQHQNPDRANRFERHHKEYVLSELAYQHLCGPTPDADLDERATLQSIAEVMKRYSLKESENLKLLDEIRENSGLLVRLPPSGLRFPHQTFLEFFAALWLIRQSNQTVAFEHYAKDPQRWREVLLLYIGLSTNADDASLAMSRLEQGDSLEMALSALVDSRAIKPSVAEDILNKTAKLLESELDPSPDNS
jgi:predicted NACHT family NTPase